MNKRDKLSTKEKALLGLAGVASIPLGIIGFVVAIVVPVGIVVLIWILCLEFLR